jgi:hypothetical protein
VSFAIGSRLQAARAVQQEDGVGVLLDLAGLAQIFKAWFGGEVARVGAETNSTIRLALR